MRSKTAKTVCCIMPLPTAADCWPVVADRRPSPLAPRCRPPWRAGHLSEVRGAKITAFSVPTNFSLRNLSPARRVITAEGTARPQVLRPEEHRTSAADRRNCQPVEVARYRVRPSRRHAIAAARRASPLSQQAVEQVAEILVRRRHVDLEAQRAGRRDVALRVVDEERPLGHHAAVGHD